MDAETTDQDAIPEFDFDPPEDEEGSGPAGIWRRVRRTKKKRRSESDSDSGKSNGRRSSREDSFRSKRSSESRHKSNRSTKSRSKSSDKRNSASRKSSSADRKRSEYKSDSDETLTIGSFRWPAIRLAVTALCAIVSFFLFPIAFADNATPRTIAFMTPLIPVFFIAYFLMTRSFRPPSFFLGLLVLFIGFFFRVHLRQRDFEDFSLDWAVYAQFSILLLAALVILFNIRRLLAVWPWADPISILWTAIIFLSGLSLIGSPNPAYGAASLGMLIVLLGTAALCAVHLRTGELQTIIALTFMPLVVLSLVSYLAQTEFNFAWGMSTDYSVPRLRGVVGTPVGLSHVCIMLAMILITKLMLGEDSRLSWGIFTAIVMPLALYVAWLSESRTPPVALVLGLTVASVLYYQPFGKHSLLISIVGGLLALPITYFMIEQGVTDSVLAGFSRTGRAEEISTLTGRLEIWQEAFKMIAQKPLLGHGLGSAVVILPEVFEGTDLDIVHTHNLFVQTAFSIGIPGAIAIVLLILTVAIRAYTQSYFFAMALLVYLIPSNITETAILSNRPSFTTVIFLLVTCRVLNLRHRGQSSSKSSQSAKKGKRARTGSKKRRRKVSNFDPEPVDLRP